MWVFEVNVEYGDATRGHAAACRPVILASQDSFISMQRVG